MLKSKVETIVKDKGFEKAVEQIRQAKGSHVNIGILSQDGMKTPPGSNLNLAAIASVNEFGTSDKRVPPRPFLRTTMEKNRRRYNRLTEQLISQILSGKTTVMKALDLLGLKIGSDVKKMITTLKNPPNAPGTIARKGSNNPLIDTGRMRSSINHEVKIKEGNFTKSDFFTGGKS